MCSYVSERITFEWLLLFWNFIFVWKILLYWWTHFKLCQKTNIKCFLFACLLVFFQFLGYNVRKSSPKAAKYQYVVKLNFTTFCFYNSRRIVYSFTGTSKILNIWSPTAHQTMSTSIICCSLNTQDPHKIHPLACNQKLLVE